MVEGKGIRRQVPWPKVPVTDVWVGMRYMASTALPPSDLPHSSNFHLHFPFCEMGWSPAGSLLCSLPALLEHAENSFLHPSADPGASQFSILSLLILSVTLSLSHCLPAQPSGPRCPDPPAQTSQPLSSKQQVQRGAWGTNGSCWMVSEA